MYIFVAVITHYLILRFRENPNANTFLQLSYLKNNKKNII